MEKQSKNEAAVWKIFMNAPGAEGLALLSHATKILIARNIIKAPRVRKAKAETKAA